jgi:hypothetical protein
LIYNKKLKQSIPKMLDYVMLDYVMLDYVMLDLYNDTNNEICLYNETYTLAIEKIEQK